MRSSRGDSGLSSALDKRSTVGGGAAFRGGTCWEGCVGDCEESRDRSKEVTSLMASLKSSSTSIGEEDGRGMDPTSLLNFLWRVGEGILGVGPAGEQGVS